MAESSASTHFRHRAQVTNSCSVLVSCAGLLNLRHCYCHMNLSTIWTVLITYCNNPFHTKRCPCSRPSRPSVPRSSENNYEKEFGPTKRSKYYNLTNVRIGLLFIILQIINMVFIILLLYMFISHNKVCYMTVLHCYSPLNFPSSPIPNKLDLWFTFTQVSSFSYVKLGCLL